MLIETGCIVNLKVDRAEDLPKLKEFMDNNNLKINMAEIGRQMGMDYRTVKKYLNGYTRPQTRDRPAAMDSYYDTIKELLESDTQIFFYKRNLYQYLKDNHGLIESESAFYHFIRAHDEFNRYFGKSKLGRSQRPVIRFETAPGYQAQMDWKERIPFVLADTGEVIELNVLVLILGHSRFRIYRPSLWMTQDILIHHLTEAFEMLGGVPKVLVTDNMRTVMDRAKTAHHKGVVNHTFEQFAKDFGFKVQPCMAASPQTKGKVESQMKYLDEIQAYSGKLTLVELFEKIEELNNRVNSVFNQGSGRVPLLDFEKEKDSLQPLPAVNVRNQYRIKTTSAKVNTASMISVKSNRYSVPKAYIGKTVTYQIHDSNVYIYDTTKLIAVHVLSDRKLNYSPNHYADILACAFPKRDKQEVERIAKRNLNILGGIYSNE